jgi:hypothetical protein
LEHLPEHCVVLDHLPGRSWKLTEEKRMKGLQLGPGTKYAALIHNYCSIKSMTDIDFGFTGRDLFLIENKKGKAEKSS